MNNILELSHDYIRTCTPHDTRFAVSQPAEGRFYLGSYGRFEGYDDNSHIYQVSANVGDGNWRLLVCDKRSNTWFIYADALLPKYIENTKLVVPADVLEVAVPIKEPIGMWGDVWYHGAMGLL